MARPPRAKNDISAPADTSLFSEDELKQLELEAQAEFDLESKTQASEAFKAELKRKLKEKALFSNGKDAEGDNVEPVLIDLAPHSPYVNIDGRLYYHGLTYKFTQAQAQTVKEVMFRTWQHEREIGGANINAEFGRTPYNRSISQVA